MVRGSQRRIVALAGEVQFLAGATAADLAWEDVGKTLGARSQRIGLADVSHRRTADASSSATQDSRDSRRKHRRFPSRTNGRGIACRARLREQ